MLNYIHFSFSVPTDLVIFIIIASTFLFSLLFYSLFEKFTTFARNRRLNVMNNVAVSVILGFPAGIIISFIILVNLKGFH